MKDRESVSIETMRVSGGYWPSSESDWLTLRNFHPKDRTAVYYPLRTTRRVPLVPGRSYVFIDGKLYASFATKQEANEAVELWKLHWKQLEGKQIGILDANRKDQSHEPDNCP